MASLKDKDFDSALAAVEEGFEQIRGFLDEYEIDEEMAAGDELRILHRLKDTITGQRPSMGGLSVRQVLEDQLRVAVENEQYERAAEIRDRIASLGTS